MSAQIIDFLSTFVQIFGQLVNFMIIARVILSWLPSRPTVFHRFIYSTTEPVLGFIRKKVPPMAMIDLSPIIAYFLINIITNLLVSGLFYVEPILSKLIG